MRGLSNRQYQWRVLLTATVYVAVTVLVWPLARVVDAVALKLLLALTPMVPMLYLFILFAARIRNSDELEQRTHLVALAVALAVTGALSVAGGFLAGSRVLPIDGTILVWVFPVMMASYGIARAIVLRRYGGDILACEGDPGIPFHIRAFLVGLLMAGMAVYSYLKRDVQGWGVCSGIALALVALGVLRLIHRRRQRRFPAEIESSDMQR